MILPHPRMIFSPFSYPIKAIHGHAPICASDPPTIRLCATVEKPHPCAGVSNCPFGAKLSRLCCSETKMFEVSN